MGKAAKFELKNVFSKDAPGTDKPLSIPQGVNRQAFKLDDIAKVLALTVAGVMQECGKGEISAPMLNELKIKIKQELLTPEKMREKVSEFNLYLEMLAGGQ